MIMRAEISLSPVWAVKIVKNNDCTYVAAQLGCFTSPNNVRTRPRLGFTNDTKTETRVMRSRRYRDQGPGTVDKKWGELYFLHIYMKLFISFCFYSNLYQWKMCSIYYFYRFLWLDCMDVVYSTFWSKLSNDGTFAYQKQLIRFLFKPLYVSLLKVRSFDSLQIVNCGTISFSVFPISIKTTPKLSNR